MAIRHREVFPEGSSPDSIDWRVWNDDHVGVAGAITQDQQDALDAANAPDAGNPFATIADIGGGGPYTDLDIIEDFLDGVSSGNTAIGAAGFRAENRANADFVGSTANHPGIFSLVTEPEGGPGEITDLGFMLGQAPPIYQSILQSGWDFTLTYAVCPGLGIADPDNLGLVTDMAANIGLTDTNLATDGDGVYFYYDSAVGPNWKCVTKDTTAETFDSGIPVVGGTWYKLKIVKVAGSAKFYINDALIHENTLHIPAIPCQFVTLVESNAAATRDLSIDLIRVQMSGFDRSLA